MATGRVAAAILAGGVGHRIGRALPKQLLPVAGRPIIEHTIAAFDRHPMVDEVVVLMAPGHLDAVRTLVDAGGYTKVGAVLEGAETRSGTARLALEHLGDDRGCRVLLHDAVRPLVSEAVIRTCVEALDAHDAVVPAVPATDTILRVVDEVVTEVPRRETLWRAQTPQGFRLPVIQEAYARAAQDPGFVATDDATVVLDYLPGVSVRVVPGEARNIKITEPLDLELAEQLLGAASDG